MANFGKLDFQVSFNPTTAFPLDARSYFESMAAAEAAAAKAGVAGSDTTTYYIGQHLVVVTETAAAMYVIQPDKTLAPAGMIVLGDGKSINIAEDGTVSMVGFAGAEAGAQPRKKADGTLEWVKPDTTTVEGLQTTVEGLESDVKTAQEAIDAVEGDMEAAQGDIKTLQDTVADMYSKGEVDALVTKVYRLMGSKNTYADLPTEGNNIGDVWNVIAADAANGIEAGENVVWNGESWDQLGGTIDLSAYATTAVVDQKIGAAKTELQGKIDDVAGDVTELDGRVEATEGRLDDAEEALGTVDQRIEDAKVIKGASEEFAISDDEKILSIIKVSAEKVDGLQDLLDDKVDKVAGKGLSTNDLTDELVEKINASDANIIEVIKVNGTALEIKDKEVNIPLATADAAGVVKSATGDNMVAVAADGTMKVEKVNVNTLTQTEGEFLVLDGGSSED